VRALLLLLFDIDGTLLQGASHEHAQALRAAMQQVYGAGGEQAPVGRRPVVQVAGRTDLEIAREVMLQSGQSAARFEAGRAELATSCVREYSKLAPADMSDRLVRGVPELLAELDACEDVLLSLVTGNLEGVARLKLSRAGIGRHFPSGQGAFGSDSEDRTDLPPTARRRAGRGRAPHPRERTIVIGDTPRDIVCARADGVRCLAVTSGPFQARALTGADGVANSTEELLELIERARR
jgi:phosphoglycolate phosphatase